MNSRELVIATRNSPLALWQAEYVKSRLQALHDGLSVRLAGFKTRGDILLDTPLAKVGGKGLFVKELEQAMLAGEADIAVHSMKDVPMEFPDGLELAVICERDDPRDALVSNHYSTLDQLPEGAVMGTSSLRRQCQLRALRPDLKIRDLRGNVNTRLAKLDAGDYDAIVLAAAGLKRLGMQQRIASLLEPELCLPAGGQGAVGIECRVEDLEVKQLLAPLSDSVTRDRVLAERALNRRLEGGCQVPIACYSVLNGEQLNMRALVGSPDGARLLRVEGADHRQNAELLGIRLADELLEQGAGEILQAVYANAD